MSGDDLTTQVLIDIRTAVRETNTRLDAVRTELKAEIRETNTRLDAVRSELGNRIDALGDRMTDLDLRMATAITEMVASNRSLHEMLANRLDVRDRVEALERDVAVLKARTA